MLSSMALVCRFKSTNRSQPSAQHAFHICSRASGIFEAGIEEFPGSYDECLSRQGNQWVRSFLFIRLFWKWPYLRGRLNWTKVVDSVTESARSMATESTKSPKKFLNTALAGPSGPSAEFTGMWPDVMYCVRHDSRAARGAQRNS